MGCDGKRESSLGPFVGNEEEGWDKVEKRMRMRTTWGESEDDPVGNGIGGGWDG